MIHCQAAFFPRRARGIDTQIYLLCCDSLSPNPRQIRRKSFGKRKARTKWVNGSRAEACQKPEPENALLGNRPRDAGNYDYDFGKLIKECELLVFVSISPPLVPFFRRPTFPSI